ncbi:perlucin-like protein [Ruditapes philippinarum]|uniref:perlucin-like protein n=1 Tax=Ruditapes philippinarum TaxID=129788 RepID=UPI00295AC647|nr:perlucin-like protein [Ruditapes philippinarum]
MDLYLNVIIISICTFAVFSCPNGWSTHNSACYLFSHDTEDWANAVTLCQILGGHLVEIEDDIENQYIVAQAKLYNSAFWIGLNDLQEENSWMWVNSNDPVKYANWAPNQPDNGGQDENCVHLYPGFSYHWNDFPCHKLNHYICEKAAENAEIIG